jgi:DNA-binding response OmpR family regulator
MHTILVIEVNQGILQNLIEILELEGFKTLQACNGKLGVELFRILYLV